MLYFGQGTATNSGVVGTDNAQFGWLKRHPEFHDVPCRDITLAGRNFETTHWDGSGKTVSTGAFLPYGTPSTPGQVIRGSVPCSGAVMRVPLTGGTPELVAWGFRNPFGLAFGPDGQLYLTQNSYDDRGSRPVWGSADVLWRVTAGTWYGWPDNAEGFPLTRLDFKGPRHVTTPVPKPAEQHHLNHMSSLQVVAVFHGPSAIAASPRRYFQRFAVLQRCFARRRVLPLHCL
jgi:Glucose / Sorbosone dehydrogenase